MLDTYVQNQGEAKGASCDTNRLESALLAHVMILVGVRYACACDMCMCMCIVNNVHVHLHVHVQHSDAVPCTSG